MKHLTTVIELETGYTYLFPYFTKKELTRELNSTPHCKRKAIFTYQSLKDALNFHPYLIIITHSDEIGKHAEKKLGRSARAFQKSISDDRGDRWTIHQSNGKISDITRDYSASF